MRLQVWAVAIAVMLAASPAAQAVGLNKGFAGESFLDTGLPGTTSGLRPELVGLILADELQAFSYLGVTGTVQSRVVREDATGTLDFYWQVDVDPSSTASPVTAFRLTDFGYDYIVDADRRIDSTGTVAPYQARVFNPLDHPSGSINFLFEDPPIGAGKSSVLFFLHTDATAYAKIAKYDLTNGQANSGTYSTFAPVVPEPSGMILGLLGLAGLASRRRR